MAPPTGLEPVTPWLTVRCSTDWAKEDCVKIFISKTVKHTASRIIFSQIETHPNLFCFAKYRKYVGVLNKQSRRFRIPLYRLLHLCRLWAIVPARLQASIVTTAKLNFCVRNGNRWTLCVWNTDFEAGKNHASCLSFRTGAPSGIRTRDPLIKSQLLYQLS